MEPPCRRPRSPAALMDELVEEIFLRVPPDEPAHLVRAALVCKPWCRILSDPGFLRRYRAFHRAPPLLGYLHMHSLYAYKGDAITRLVSTTAASLLPPPALGYYYYSWVLDCRHGRVLLISASSHQHHLIIWDPITGDKKKLCVPLYPHTYYAGAVLCAAVDGCDHLDCRGGPFLVVYVGTYDSGNNLDTWASMYSSETGVWSASVSIDVHDNPIEATKPSLLIGDALYFTFHCGTSILKYDLGTHGLTEIDSPGVSGSIVMEVEAGALGYIAVLDNCIYKWLWQARANGTGMWAQHKVMKLETLLPRPAPSTSYEVIGFVEGTDTIFINGYAGVFTLELKSRKVKKVGETGGYYAIFPYRSFYTPVLAKGRLSLP